MFEQDRIFHLLLVDDDSAGLTLLEIGFRQCARVQLQTHRLTFPKDIVSYLYRKPPYQEAVRPDLIVLDYHTATDGGASLSLIKGNPDTQQLPIVVVTGSENPADIADVYYRHANACYWKPLDLEGIMTLTCQIATHWLTQAVLPRREDVTNIHPQTWKDPQPNP